MEALVALRCSQVRGSRTTGNAHPVSWQDPWSGCLPCCAGDSVILGTRPSNLSVLLSARHGCLLHGKVAEGKSLGREEGAWKRC